MSGPIEETITEEMAVAADDTAPVADATPAADPAPAGDAGGDPPADPEPQPDPEPAPLAAAPAEPVFTEEYLAGFDAALAKAYAMIAAEDTYKASFIKAIKP